MFWWRIPNRLAYYPILILTIAMIPIIIAGWIYGDDVLLCFIGPILLELILLATFLFIRKQKKEGKESKWLADQSDSESPHVKIEWAIIIFEIIFFIIALVLGLIL